MDTLSPPSIVSGSFDTSLFPIARMTSLLVLTIALEYRLLKSNLSNDSILEGTELNAFITFLVLASALLVTRISFSSFNLSIVNFVISDMHSFEIALE